MKQISLWCDLAELWNNTVEITKTHKIILIQEAYDESINDKQNQYVTGYVIIAEILEKEK